MKNYNELTLKEIALLEVLVSEYGYDKDELLEDDGELLESLKDDYLVLDDSEASNEAYTSVENLIDDIGVASFNVNLENYMDNQDWFEDAFRESYYSYANDIESESASNDDFENRLEEEMSDRGVDSIDDFVESILSDIPDFIEEFKSEYGDDCFNKVIIDNNLVNVDSLINDVIDIDGRGHILSGYDGVEHEVNVEGVTLFVYRIN